ncbi:HAD-IA family hydrolase [Pseudomonas putida]|nr:HAD-IA family hydrolase [Pseudomonas putida]MDP9524071.1 HAD-IA family hydrolase [Pseudomonas putida]
MQVLQAWKPDPEILLHAAQRLALPADKCLVVEDSLSGVEAGLLAGCH